MVTVSFEMLPGRPEVPPGRKQDPPALHGGQQQGGVAALGKVPVGSHYGVVIGQGPEAVVEEPVGVLGEGQAVVRVVVAAGGEVVDVKNATTYSD